jgi:hypothetical protein
MSDAIFIVGYYRSGTSALSGALQRLGVKFFNEADPNEHNPLGFYEIPELIEFDVDLFNRLGVEWTDVRGLPEGWAERADVAPLLSRLDAVLRRRFPPEDAIWGLKHPHLCRTLPLYERAARLAGHVPHVVHIFRDPWTAAASQQHKNGLSRAHALLLWMSYVTSAERQARHLRRSWVTYRDLLARPGEQLERIGQDLALALARRLPGGLKDAAGYLNRQLDRSAPVAREGLSRPLGALVSRAWAAIEAREFGPDLWDGLAGETADMVGFLSEIGASRARAIPGFGGGLFTSGAAAMPENMALRPAERLDDGARMRLLARRDAGPALPRVAVAIVAPAGRAAAISDTLAALKAQWHAVDEVRIIAADFVAIEGQLVVHVSGAPGEMTQKLCAEMQDMAGKADYVAVLNAGDVVAPDACLRFALAALAGPDMIYCDEIVPREGGAWVRHKPALDVTRLRQSAYIGDWIWYQGETLRRLGGFDAGFAGAEEYEFQLRLAEAGAEVLRLPEALFTRSPQSRRDDIAAEVFCARAAAAITAHLQRSGMAAEVQNRQHLGLFHHLRLAPDPGTSMILLCDGAEIPALDGWLAGLLTRDNLTGPVILAGTALSPPVVNYLTAVAQQRVALEGKVLAVPPVPGLRPGAALRQALAMVETPYVAVLDARARPDGPYWAERLRARLEDPGVVLAAARTLVPVAHDAKQFTVQGPIVLGADTRLGAGHMPDDPGPGGWLMVDQEASALAPPALLGRTAALAACAFADLAGDALWIDLGAQLRALGGRLVWTPDVSFTAPAEVIATGDAAGCRGSGILPWIDPYHHPALSLHGDLLAEEQRRGLVRAFPADAQALLVTGTPEHGASVLNAVRALRGAGLLEAGWAPEMPSAAELGRFAPACWLRINPETLPSEGSPPFSAIFTRMPVPEALPVIAAAARCFATSPDLVKQLRALGPQVALWRPALSARVWEAFVPATGLNTKPRVLWIDEGMTPAWLPELINATLEAATWIVVAREEVKFTGAVARLAWPADEYGWARALGEVAPQILVRPAGRVADADAYHALLAAAAGCHLLVDDRLDLPASLGAIRPGHRLPAWQRALGHAITHLTATLQHGQRARAAALALVPAEAALPAWASPGPGAAAAAMRDAAE